MEEGKEYDVQYSTGEELPLMVRWVQRLRKWYPVSSDADVDIMCGNWIGFHRYKASLTALHEGAPVGVVTLFLMPYRKLIHHALIYLVVDPEIDISCVAKSLVLKAHELGRSRFGFQWLDVELYEGCPYLPVFDSVGYVKLFEQPCFVKTKEEGYLSRIFLRCELLGS